MEAIVYARLGFTMGNSLGGAGEEGDLGFPLKLCTAFLSFLALGVMPGVSFCFIISLGDVEEEV